MNPAVSDLLKGRQLHLWEYRVGHCSLLLRSPADRDHATNVDIVSVGIDYLELPTSLGEVHIETPTPDETARVELILKERIPTPLVLSILVAGKQRFALVGSCPRAEQNGLNLYDSYFADLGRASWDSNWPRWLHGANELWRDGFRGRTETLRRMERSAIGEPTDWDYSTDRFFQLWDYSEATGRLVLRSTKSDKERTTVDVACLGVKYLEMPTSLRGLKVIETPPAERHRLQEILEKKIQPNEILTIESEGHAFSIVAESMFLQENRLELFESPFWKPPPPRN